MNYVRQGGGMLKTYKSLQWEGAGVWKGPTLTYVIYEWPLNCKGLVSKFTGYMGTMAWGVLPPSLLSTIECDYSLKFICILCHSA